MSRYAVKIVLSDGRLMRATVTKATLRGLSVSWVKVRQ